jgi:hypothetical protein
MDKYLRIYLSDQLALGVLWRELAKRARRHNRGTPLGDAIARVATAISEDITTFETIMSRVGARPNPAKNGLVMAAERLARIKLNGHVTSYSPLSRFLELEVLTMGIDRKKQLWTTLRDLAGLAARLPDIDFDQLIDRAEQQRAELEPFRVRFGAQTLASTVDAPGR